jgi:hypothetical protein
MADGAENAAPVCDQSMERADPPAEAPGQPVEPAEAAPIAEEEQPCVTDAPADEQGCVQTTPPLQEPAPVGYQCRGVHALCCPVLWPAYVACGEIDHSYPLRVLRCFTCGLPCWAFALGWVAPMHIAGEQCHCGRVSNVLACNGQKWLPGDWMCKGGTACCYHQTRPAR